MSKRFTLLLAILILSGMYPLMRANARQIRVKPMLQNDEEFNAILTHVASNFVIEVPDGKEIDKVENDVRCRFTIDKAGRFENLTIVSTPNADDVVRMSDVSNRNIWLHRAIVEALKVIPPFSENLRNSKRKRERTMIFSFGSYRPDPINIKSIGFDGKTVQANIDNRLESYREEKTEALKAETQKWDGYTKANIRETITPKATSTSPLPPQTLIQQPPKIETPPQTEISITLQ